MGWLLRRGSLGLLTVSPSSSLTACLRGLSVCMVPGGDALRVPTTTTATTVQIEPKTAQNEPENPLSSSLPEADTGHCIVGSPWECGTDFVSEQAKRYNICKFSGRIVSRWQTKDNSSD